MSLQPCDSCGQPSETPTCLTCRSTMQRLGSGGADHRLALRLADARRWLGEIPSLYALLPVFRLPGSAPQDPDRRSGKSNPAHRSVVNVTVLDLTDVREKADTEPTRTDYDVDRRAGARREGVLPTLTRWARRADGELWDLGAEHEPLEDDGEVKDRCEFLARHLAWISQQPWFNEVHDELRSIRADVRVSIGDRDPVTYDCPDCDWPVREKFDRQVFVCTGCERTWTMANEIDALMAKQQSVMSIGDCAREVGRPVGTLHHWKSQGWISSTAQDRVRKCDLFDVRLVRRVAESVQNGRRTELSA